MVNLEFPFHFTFLFLDCGRTRKPLTHSENMRTPHRNVQEFFAKIITYTKKEREKKLADSR